MMNRKLFSFIPRSSFSIHRFFSSLIPSLAALDAQVNVCYKNHRAPRTSFQAMCGAHLPQ
jgi:hypothetical protein